MLRRSTWLTPHWMKWRILSPLTLMQPCVLLTLFYQAWSNGKLLVTCVACLIIMGHSGSKAWFSTLVPWLGLYHLRCLLRIPERRLFCLPFLVRLEKKSRRTILLSNTLTHILLWVSVIIGKFGDNAMTRCPSFQRFANLLWWFPTLVHMLPQFLGKWDWHAVLLTADVQIPRLLTGPMLCSITLWHWLAYQASLSGTRMDCTKTFGGVQWLKLHAKRRKRRNYM